MLSITLDLKHDLLVYVINEDVPLRVEETFESLDDTTVNTVMVDCHHHFRNI